MITLALRLSNIILVVTTEPAKTEELRLGDGTILESENVVTSSFVNM